ncbi:MAG: lasso peptide biosynthesis B2 protein, partial [Acidobacteriaceae bacterium]
LLLRPHVSLLKSQEGLPQPDDDACLSNVLRDLSANELLRTRLTDSAAGDKLGILQSPDTVIAPRPPFREHVSMRHAARYFASALGAKTALRMRSLYRIVLSERRKAAMRADVRRTFDPARAAPLCSAYARMRVIATGPRQCLFDALALKLFLAKYGVFPDWIFGVRINPFAAHCWLQDGRTVLNDSLDSVRRFTPIMTV